MSVHLVYITYNRLPYTRLSLPSILADPSEEFSLTIWDNASEDGTQEYLKNEVNDPRIVDIVLSKENIGQTEAVNRIWDGSKSDFLGKLDNDCIMTPGWTRALAEAHRDIEKLGAVACWHFFPDEFDYERAKHKIQTYGKHQILRHPWTCGTGLLIKRDTFHRMGPIRGKTTTKYWLEMAKVGYINGFYYPLIHQEHMDDIRSEHNLMRAQNLSFAETYKHSPGYTGGATQDLEEYNYWHEKILGNLLDDPYDYRAYVGWRASFRYLKERFSTAMHKRKRSAPKSE